MSIDHDEERHVLIFGNLSCIGLIIWVVVMVHDLAIDFVDMIEGQGEILLEQGLPFLRIVEVVTLP